MYRIFRLWNKKTNMWQTRYLEKTSIFFYGWEREVIDSQNLKDLFVRNEDIGFKDRREVIIFEDDIARLSIKDGDHIIYIIGVIKMFAPSYALVSPQGIFPISESDSINLEVVGNIHENNTFTSFNNPMRLKFEDLQVHNESECVAV